MKNYYHENHFFVYENSLLEAHPKSHRRSSGKTSKLDNVAFPKDRFPIRPRSPAKAMTLTRIDPHLLRYIDPGIDRPRLRKCFPERNYLEKEPCGSWVSLSERSRVEMRERVRAALEALPPRDRELLVLQYMEQLSAREIAAVVGISEGAVNMRHLRALERLRGLLDEDLAE